MSLLKQLTTQITALQSKIPEELFQIKVQLKSALENSEIRALKKENKRLQTQIRKLEKQLIAVLLRENKKEVIDLSSNDELVPIKEEQLTPNTLHKKFIQKQNITISSPEIIDVQEVAADAVEDAVEDTVEEEVATDAVEEEEEVAADAVEVAADDVEEEVDAVEEEVAADTVEEVASDAVEEEEQEEVDEVEEEEVEEVEVEVEVEVVEEEDAVEEEEEESVYEVVIKGKTYYVTNEVDSVIYDADENGDISIEVGVYNAGVPTFKK